MRLRPSWMIATAMFAAIVLPPDTSAAAGASLEIGGQKV